MLVDPATLFEGTVLILAPHMDDEVLACGGTISRLPQKDRIHVIYATDGMKSPSPIVPWRDSISEDLGLVRMNESRAAMRHLGLPERNTHFLGLPEADLQSNTTALAEILIKWIADLKPSVILMPFRYDRHPDHLAINHVITAAYQKGKFQWARLFEYFIYYRWRLLPQKDVRKYVSPEYLVQVDIADVANCKRSALDLFKSQTTIYYPWQTRPILRPQLLDEECQYPEQFLQYDPKVPGNSIFSGLTLWIRVVHRLEPFLQKRKYQVSAFLKRVLGENEPQAI